MQHLGLQLAVWHGALLALCLAAAVQSQTAGGMTVPASDAQLPELDATAPLLTLVSRKL